MNTNYSLSFKTAIFTLGNSNVVRIPKRLLESLSYAVNEPVELSVGENNSIVIKKAASKPYRTIEDRFAGYTGDYRPGEWDTGKPVGKEIF